MVGGVEERVRYIGIDTPELNTSSPATPDPYAEAATEANARLLAGGRLVLEKDVSERDQYDRLLRNVWLERDGAWTFVNLALVAEGYAQVSTYPPDVKYVDVLLAAQRVAREERARAVGRVAAVTASRGRRLDTDRRQPVPAKLARPRRRMRPWTTA